MINNITEVSRYNLHTPKKKHSNTNSKPEDNNKDMANGCSAGGKDILDAIEDLRSSLRHNITEEICIISDKPVSRETPG